MLVLFLLADIKMQPQSVPRDARIGLQLTF